MHRPVADVTVGSDILEIVGIAMYAEPLVVFRELVQNAADGIDKAIRAGILGSKDGAIAVAFERESRSVRITDNGFGLPNDRFESQMLALGASSKRGDGYRGFRGIGRLAGLGHCRSLVFRSKSRGDRAIYEARWDGSAVKELMLESDVVPLEELVAKSVRISTEPEADLDAHFFEVKLEGIRRLSDDRLFDIHQISQYLSETAPVPFHPDFTFAEEIRSNLERRAPLLEVNLRVADRQIFKPHRNDLPVRGNRLTTIKAVEFIEVPSRDESLAAFGWIAHTEYLGALNAFAGSGLRVRSGNLQIGDGDILARAFPEERFNRWTLGEFHVYDPRLRPNARRDAFEPSVYVDNLFNQLIPYGVAIVKRCRQESRRRNAAKKAVSLRLSIDILNKSLTRNTSALADSVRKYLSEHYEAELATLRSLTSDDEESRHLLGLIEGIESDIARVMRIRGAASLNARDRGHMDAVRWLRETGREDLIGHFVAEMKKL